ncbi:MAG: hypothetical protein ACYDB8_09160, partial [Acidiferrobacterales bacterium]
MGSGKIDTHSGPASKNADEAPARIVSVRGSPALSAFRHRRLLERMRRVVPEVAAVQAEYW